MISVDQHKMALLLVVISTLIGVSLQACDPKNCTLPDCRCYNDPKAPGGLDTADIPQLIMVSFEGTINSDNIKNYQPILPSALVNPNGCPARGTFFIEDEGTDYAIVKSLYDEGHEIGIQSVNGNSPNDSTGWIEAIKKVKQQLVDIGIDEKDIVGIRVPELVIGGTDEIIGLSTNKLLYDSSCSNVGFSDPDSFLWPYTFDGIPVASCDNGKAPDVPFEGIWEMIIADLHDLTGQKLPCVVPSGCRNVTTKRDAFELFFTAFEERYTGKRTPFNMIIDPAFAANEDKRDGVAEFLEYVRAAFQDDVWIVPLSKGLEWVRDPTPIANITSFAPFSCN